MDSETQSLIPQDYTHRPLRRAAGIVLVSFVRDLPDYLRKTTEYIKTFSQNIEHKLWDLEDTLILTVGKFIVKNVGGFGTTKMCPEYYFPRHPEIHNEKPEIECQHTLGDQ